MNEKPRFQSAKAEFNLRPVARAYVVTNLAILSIVTVLMACNSNPKSSCDNRCIIDSDTLCFDGHFIDGREQSIFVYNKVSGGNERFEQAGFFNNGFRDGKWRYNLNGSIKSIGWACFKDTGQNFETNLFENVDAIKHGDHFTIFKFGQLYDSVKMTISMNRTLPASPTPDFSEQIRSDFSDLGIKVAELQIVDLKNVNTFRVFSCKLVDSLTLKESFMIGLYGTDSSQDFIEVSCASYKNGFFLDKLFWGVVSNLFVGKHRIYSPYLE